MGVRIIIASLLAAVITFMWGFVFWTVLPYSHNVIKAPSEEMALSAKSSIPDSGVYIYPASEKPMSEMTDEDMEQLTRQHKAGPVMMLFITKEGSEPMPPSTFVFGFLHYFATAILAACILAIAAPILPSFGKRFGFALLLFVFAAVWHEPAKSIWFMFSWDWCLLQMSYTIVGGLLFGLVLASIVKCRNTTHLPSVR